MCGSVLSFTTLGVGAVLVAVSSIVAFGLLPGIIDKTIANQVVLLNDSIQLERFLNIPFPLDFSIRVFNVTNTAEVLSGGVPTVQELGPYVYKLYQQRVVDSMTDEVIRYRIMTNYEFDSEASYPNTEEDLVTIANVPYNSVLQVAEKLVPNLMSLVNTGLTGVFRELNSPFMTVRVGDLIFDGIPLCERPGIFGAPVCRVIRDLAESIDNLDVQTDGSVVFSLFAHKKGKYGKVYEVDRGVSDPRQMAAITEWDDANFLPFWSPDSPCSMLNGTDTSVYGPFVDPSRSVYAFNSDICRSVELRYQENTEHMGIPAMRFAANEWFLADEDGCYCLNVTTGDNAPNGCLKYGAMEMYSCLGSYLVLTYPHFLFTHPDYANGVNGLTPNRDSHRIFLDLEPNTGTPVRGAKRAQVNVFLRTVRGIPATSALNTTLTPIFWLEEAVTLPEQYVDELQRRLLDPLSLVNVLVPVLLATSAVILLVGAALTVRAVRLRPGNISATPSLTTKPEARTTAP